MSLIGPQLGALRDGEEDAFVDPDALGDDTDNLADEDGVDFGVFRMGQDNVVTVTVQNIPATGAYIDAWLDYEGDGDWYDFQDQIIFSYYVPADGSYDIPNSCPVWNGRRDVRPCSYQRIRHIVSGRIRSQR